ncbi:dual specificity calcium/calmodulin-dependent 3',5'-cyclic nucleotide phosphodiesterase 1-like isoform X1 [Dermacentor andersoni]|uniref:dual specificity calcium/calmodulin-dependent 3',5'-cyclic nucleotide phosphodiesterase 1-like isoform X1 n=1 Tax=Dermacentor andersoni TaxID=34620 RepID=UPI0024175986|nr:dual specificity calcium/calmodulin-dependent 3',5'-cyclic nucleotide phosphodiesterase 1C-like isoform X1 [Dermacentor andersoni]
MQIDGPGAPESSLLAQNRMGKDALQKSNSVPLMTGNSRRPEATKKCVLRLDGYSYLIVANPPPEAPAKDAPEGEAEEEDAGDPTKPGTVVVRRFQPRVATVVREKAGEQCDESGRQNEDDAETEAAAGERRNGKSHGALGDARPLPPVDTLEACDKAANRLRDLSTHLQHGDVPLDMLQKTLQYAACVLEAVCQDETRRQTPIPPQPPPSSLLETPLPPSGVATSLSVCPNEKKIPATDVLPADSVPRQPGVEQRRRALINANSKFNSGSFSKGAQSFFRVVENDLAACRKMLDEEDDLSEVQPDAVPNEVREWLASTFTRQAATQRKRSEDKPRFRSVANAIRAGIMVEKIYRRMSSSTLLQIPNHLAALLKSVDDWCFDVFNVNEVANGQVLRYLTYELFGRYGIVHKFKVSSAALENFITAVEQGYCKYKNPYHNNLHAADVTQTVHYMLYSAGIGGWLTELEAFATLFAAIIHDYEHTGTTNNFHVMSRSETALIYNDRSVLENHHISAAFRLLTDDDQNILSSLSKEEYKEFRLLVIEMVLATDMTSHFQQVKTMKTALSHHDFSLDKAKALSLILHCCDISHPSKEWRLHHRWTYLLMEEFFQQGDKEHELGLPYSPLCDRNTTLIAESQIGFIDFILNPTMDVCGDLLEKILLQVSQRTTEDSISEEGSENKGTEALSEDDAKTQDDSKAKDDAKQQNDSKEEDAKPHEEGKKQNEEKIQQRSLSMVRPIRTTSTTSITSLSSITATSTDEGIKCGKMESAPSSPRSPKGQLAPKKLKRPWLKYLEENRSMWQERAAQDAEARRKRASQENEAVESTRAESMPVESKTALLKSQQSKPLDSKASEAKLLESTSPEPQPTSSRALEFMPVD